ncbi:MAG TPA: ferritin-like domain-containing protein [Pyrinomonadaceae bacterium]|jgi:rubrerythrin
MFETDKEVLQWYENQPRALTKDFVNEIPWSEIKDHSLKPQFVPVLLYMRDVEYCTDMYYRELLRTPTGRDPVIRRFMDRWSVEELHHANLLNRFLNEAGFPTDEQWQNEVMRKIPWHYKVQAYLLDVLVKPFGRHFHAAHMVWGAINEITTLQGYRRLAALSGHPVLRQLLSGIVQEEAVHSSFYWNLARVKLNQAKFSQDLARFIVGRFWGPVGQGPKTEGEMHYVVRTLFWGTTGLEQFNCKVANRIARLPGFEGFTALSEKIAPIVQG